MFSSAIPPAPQGAYGHSPYLTEPSLALLRTENTDPAGMDHHKLVINSLKTAFVWGNAGIAQLVQSG